MAVTAVPRTGAHAPLQAAVLPPAVLVLTLISPAFDLLAVVQPGVASGSVGLLAAAVSSATLLLSWGRYPRTSWLAAASLAGFASVAVRAMNLDVAPLLSLLAVLALGIGGAFASPTREAEAWLL